MKNLLWLSLTFLMFSVLSCSRSQRTLVTGLVEQGRGMIYLEEQEIGKVRLVDSTRLKKNGGFSLKARIEIPGFFNLRLGKREIIPLLLHPGDRIEILAEAESFSSGYSVKGSEESLYLKELNEKLQDTRKSLDSLAAVVNGNPGAGPEDLEEINGKYNDLMQSQRRFSIQFVLEHRNSLAAIYALYQKIDENQYILNTTRDIQLLKITALALDTLYPQSEYVRSLKQEANRLEMELYNRGWQNIVESAPISFPEIRLPDPDGDTIALSSLAGKVIILSFWASWNEESLVLNQELKRLYEKYHPRGLEVYQVSFDNKISEWKAAIRYDELPWINVSELSYPESAVALLYNITGLPTYFLIDQEGEIIGRNFDRVTLDRRIAELFI